MLDIAIGIIELLDPHGKLHSVGTNILTGKPEKWKNSKYDIIFGDSINFIMGLGRQTNVFGPDIKSILDWTVLADWIGETAHHAGWAYSAKAWEIAWGQGGSTDFILGNKNLFNYGTSDFSITRKKHPATEVKLIGDIDTHGGPSAWWMRFFIGLYAAFQITFGITIRILYMGVGINVDDHEEKEHRKELVELLMVIQGNAGIRILTLLKMVETAYFTQKSIEERNQVANHQKDVMTVNLNRLIVMRKARIVPNQNADLRAVEPQAGNLLLALQQENVNEDMAGVVANAQAAVADGLMPLVGYREGGDDDIESTNYAKTFVHQKDVRWHCGKGFTFISNPQIYADKRKAPVDPADKSKAPVDPEIVDTEYNQEPNGFDFRIFYGENDKQEINHVSLQKGGFFVKNEKPKAISLLNGINGDNWDRSGLSLAKSAITLDCGKISGGPSLDMKSSDSEVNGWISLSQNKRPNEEKGSKIFYAPTLYMDGGIAGFYGGEMKGNNNDDAGFIELKPDSVLIKFRGSQIQLDKNGIELTSSLAVKINSDTKIEIKCKNSEIYIVPEKISIKAGESELVADVAGIKQSSVTFEQKIESTLSNQAALIQSQSQAINELKAALNKNG